MSYNSYHYVDKKLPIFSWVRTSGLAKKLNIGYGFYVEGSMNIVCTDGSTRHLITWLKGIGFIDGSEICGHQVVLSTSTISRALDRMEFRQVAINSPFDEWGEQFDDLPTDEELGEPVVPVYGRRKQY